MRRVVPNGGYTSLFSVNSNLSKRTSLPLRVSINGRPNYVKYVTNIVYKTIDYANTNHFVAMPLKSYTLSINLVHTKKMFSGKT